MIVKASMNQEPKARRQIVSKGEYADNIVWKAFVYILGIFLCLLFLLCLVALGVIVFEAKQEGVPASYVPFFAFLVLAMAGGGWFLFPRAKQVIQAAKYIDPGIPFTRANTADMPANDSLVRASQEPAQAQEGVLLRAATGETQAQDARQLLRASVGEQL